jgi:hypothetical protein
MNELDKTFNNTAPEGAVESFDSPNFGKSLGWRDYRLNYFTQSAGAVTKGYFILTSRGGAITGTRTKTEHNGNNITPETHPVDGSFLNNKLKLYREIPGSNVVQIYDMTLSTQGNNRFDGRYYNIGGNSDAGEIYMIGE